MEEVDSLLGLARLMRNDPDGTIIGLEGPIEKGGPSATLALTLVTEFSHESWAQSSKDPDPFKSEFWEYLYCWRTETEDPKIEVVEKKLEEIYNVVKIEISRDTLEIEHAPEFNAYRHAAILRIFTK